MKKPPKKDEVNFVVAIYKDMELADEIETADSFENYSEALDFYNEEVKKAENKYFIELTFEVETEEYGFKQIQLAHNATK